MSKKFVLAAAIFGSFCAGAVVIPFVFGIFESRDAAGFLPPLPAVRQTTVTSVKTKVFPTFAKRDFLFTSQETASADQMESMFAVQLTANGWERISKGVGANIAASSWRRRMPFEQELSFTILQTNVPERFVGSMVTVPY